MTRNTPDQRRWYGFARVENAFQVRHVSRIVVCAAVYVAISSVLFVAFYVQRVGPLVGDAHRLTLGWVLSMGGMSALFALLVGVYVTRRIAGPIHRIKCDLDRFLGGDESARIRLRGRDELADLADRINRALDAKAGAGSAGGAPALSALRAEILKVAEEMRASGGPGASEALDALSERLEALATPAGRAER